MDLPRSLDFSGSSWTTPDLYFQVKRSTLSLFEMEAAPDPKDATDFRFRQLSKVKLVSDCGNESIINPAENSQRLAISNKLGLVFAGKSGVIVLCTFISDFLLNPRLFYGRFSAFGG